MSKKRKRKSSSPKPDSLAPGSQAAGAPASKRQNQEAASVEPTRAAVSGVPEQDGERALSSAVGDPKSTQARDGAASSPPPESQFTRYFSFAALLGVIILVGFVFYEVMAGFLVPLFLAMILVVVFRPLHRWILSKSPERKTLAAVATTLIVMFMVLAPLLLVLVMAAIEGQQMIREFNVAQLTRNARQIRSKLNLEVPPELTQLSHEFEILRGQASLSVETEDAHRVALFEAEAATKALLSKLTFQTAVAPEAKDAAGDSSDRVDDQADSPAKAPAEDVAGNSPPKSSEACETLARQLAQLREMHRVIAWESSADDDAYQVQMEQHHDYQAQVSAAFGQFTALKHQLLGGKAQAWLAEMINPSPEQTEKYFSSVIGWLREYLFTIGGKGATFLVKMVLSLVIMIVAFYFFLLDGPAMIDTFKGLSPMDDEHEEELVVEFAQVSRAVVLATLLSALAQGLLAGIGFYFAGLESIFLLTVLSGVMAMVPFFGAASVWIPCALYLYFVDNNLTAAIGLAIYGAAIVSTVDNFIKPWVLHGQSKLHPLFAFLSVIGGVGALGPIGILIGPMVVAFLQTLLEILRHEMATWDGDQATQDQTATGPADGTPATAT